MGSGKTANCVRDMVMNQTKTSYYTNIIPKRPKQTPWIHTINSSMIFKKTTEENPSGRGKPKTKIEFNKEYWDKIPRPISFVYDEAHEIFSARNSMSVINRVMANMTAMARRICGEGRNDSDLVYVTQLDRRIDVIAREMATLIKYHVMHYFVTCKKCGLSWAETSEMPEKAKVCCRCGHYLLSRSNFVIEVTHYANIKAYDAWRDFGIPTHHMKYYITDIEKYFPFYSTMQWEGLFDDVYAET